MGNHKLNPVAYAAKNGTLAPRVEVPSCIIEFEYQMFDDRYFVHVHNTFAHHYTGEAMRYIQVDWVNEKGIAETEFNTVNAGEFQLMYDLRIGEIVNAEEKSSGDD